jgi:hypothetical protein
MTGDGRTLAVEDTGGNVHSLEIVSTCNHGGPLSLLIIKDFLPQQHKSRSHYNGWQNGPHKQFYR